MKTLITIDFDFFVPEDPMWDIGHRESLLYLKMLWGTRMSLLDKMKTNGKEHTFWYWLASRVDLKTAPFFVSDSHCFAYNLLSGVNRVISFDAHHDCWKNNSKKGEVFCDNWLRAWLEGGKRRKATWVRPDWLDKELLLLDKNMKSRVEVRDFGSIASLGLKGPVIVHICRSGCWVPPWLDKAFLGFLMASGRSLERMSVMQEGEWNPMAERWSEDDFKQVLAAEENVKRMREEMEYLGSKLAEVKTGVMKSTDFVNGMVEVRSNE